MSALKSLDSLGAKPHVLESHISVAQVQLFAILLAGHTFYKEARWFLLFSDFREIGQPTKEAVVTPRNGIC